MKLHVLMGLLVIVVVTACSKDNITTTPQLRLKSVSSDYIPLNAGIQFVLEFSDKEGDLSRPVAVEKISSSFVAGSCEGPSYLDTGSFLFPDIPGVKNTDGILEINLANTDLAKIACHGQDTLETAIFRFWIKDDAGNTSDTVVTGPITIEKEF